MKALFVISIAIATLVPAGVYGQAEYAYPPYGYLGADAYYGGYGGYGYSSSTAEEGYARGTADVIRSQGVYNQLSADAAVRLEEARKRYIENYKQAVDTYFQVRDQYKARRDQELGEKRERLASWLQQRNTEVPRLSESQLDRGTGEIWWPKVLMDEAFTEQRITLDELFAKRAEQGGLYTIADRNKVQNATVEMLDELRGRGAELHSSDKILARRFIETLANELHFVR
ncbi:MAG: hypothetical protein H6822_02725 [Planctomycetaceae bacterium]|nr:hypothetical protein [Planctomycetales bacterium]MCB9921065.1 hypothetical protein [Planctomycetaceae bacterium]